MGNVNLQSNNVLSAIDQTFAKSEGSSGGWQGPPPGDYQVLLMEISAESKGDIRYKVNGEAKKGQGVRVALKMRVEGPVEEADLTYSPDITGTEFEDDFLLMPYSNIPEENAKVRFQIAEANVKTLCSKILHRPPLEITSVSAALAEVEQVVNGDEGVMFNITIKKKGQYHSVYYNEMIAGPSI